MMLFSSARRHGISIPRTEVTRTRGNSQRRQVQRGFTLIEMVVSLGLMVLLLGGSIVGYQRFNSRQQVITAGKGFVSTLRLAQKRASVGDKPDAVGCNSGEKLDGYRVAAAQSATSYTMAPLCNGVEVAASRVTYTLPQTVVFMQAVDVRFLVLVRGVQLGNGGQTQTFDLGNEQAPGYKYSVRVSNSGEIYEIGITAL